MKYSEWGRPMLRRLLVIAWILALFAAPAAAADTAECAKKLATVDDLIAKNPKIPPAEMEKAKHLREQGVVLMNGGKTRECKYAFTRAEKILVKGVKK